jgi:hypothetical protein
MQGVRARARGRDEVEKEVAVRASICFSTSLRCPSRDDPGSLRRARRQRDELFEAKFFSAPWNLDELSVFY